MHPLTKPRAIPYVWATWLPRLLAGESSCVGSAWLRAHYVPAKADSDPAFDLETWRLDHTDLLRKAAAEYAAQGYTVAVEDQNRFVLNGKLGTLAGRPDLVAVRGGEGVIVDAKTGNPRESDRVQVMLYMWALPRTNPAYAGVRFAGRVQYRARYTVVTPDEVDAVFVGRLAGLMKEVCGSDEPRTAPSFRECQRCPLRPEDCADRVETETVCAGVTEEF